MLLTVIMAFAGAQTARAQGPEPKPCNVTFDISGEGTVKFGGETVTNDETILVDRDLTSIAMFEMALLPDEGYVVSSATYQLFKYYYNKTFTLITSGVLSNDEGNHWSFVINDYPYDNSNSLPVITVYIVFDKALAGGDDEASAVELTEDDDLSRLAGGWYKVESDLTIDNTVNLHGDTHITIATGATLTISTFDEYGIYDSALTVSTSDQYGISGSALTVSGEGTLAVSASNRAIYVDNYTQTGCAVTLSGSAYELHAKNNVTITGGSITSTGIEANAITLGWTSATDYIDVEFYNGPVTIATGKRFVAYDETTPTAIVGTGTVDSRIIDGRKLCPLDHYLVTSDDANVTIGSGTPTFTIDGTDYYAYDSGATVALGSNREGYIADYTASPSQTISNGSFTMPAEDVSVSATWTPDPDDFAVSSDGNTYTIKSAAGWGVFCDALQDLDTYNRFIGKTVKLADDITVSRMAGSDSHDFCGTFDGQEHTLTFNYSTDTDDAAPFRYVEDGCVIKDLRVCGTIQTSAKFAAGLIAHQYGNVTIRNCRSSVTIKSSFSSGNGDGTHGGFVAQNHNAGDITFEGCLFDGKLLTTGSTATTRCGGFVGWRSNNEGAVIKVKNSLYAPAALEVGEYWISTTESATFVRDGIASDITNSYYTSDFNDGSSFTGQGKQLRSIAAGEGVTLGHAGAATEYSVSGITAYKASGASGDDAPFIAGILYDGVLYAGNGDEVSLTLTNSSGDAPLGYQWAYSVTGGATLSGSTLTMADADVTVSFTPGALRSTGEAVPISYINEDGILCDGQDGRPAPASAIALDGTESTLDAGWYFVGADISRSGKIGCYGNVNIILTDGKTMTVNGGSSGIYNDSGSSRPLTIYGQTLGTGTLNVTGSNIGINYIDGNVVIRGGTVKATGTTGAGIVASGNVTITGGQVSATGNYVGINAGGSVTITGGQVSATFTATATGEEAGIYAWDGNITLGWTRPADRITASSISTGGGTVAVADGQALTDGSGNIYTGTLTASELSGFAAETTLQPALQLAAAADNTAAIDAHAGQTLAVQLQGRTLYKDGAWNTLVLPFNLGDTDASKDHWFDGTPLEGATVMTLANSPSSGTGFDTTTGTLTLYFIDADRIEAGVPYIVKWPATTPNYVENPVFTGVTVENGLNDVTFTGGSFKGTYNKLEYTTENKSILFLGEGNTLYYPQPSGNDIPTIGAFRAYFDLGGAHARQFVLNFGEGTQNGIGHTEITEITEKAGAWYTLDGVRLDAQPTKKGLYIHGGRKVVIP